MASKMETSMTLDGVAATGKVAHASPALTVSTEFEEETDSELDDMCLEDREDTSSGEASDEDEFMDLDDILAIGSPKNAKTRSWEVTTPYRPSIIDDFGPLTGAAEAMVAAKPRRDIPAPAAQKLLDYVKAFFKRRAQSAHLRTQAAFMVPTQCDKKPFDKHRQKLMVMVDELNGAFRDDAFQTSLDNLFRAAERRLNLSRGRDLGYVEGRLELVRSVHRRILPRFGYGASSLGVSSMYLALKPYASDIEILDRLSYTDELLRLPPYTTLNDIYVTADMCLPGGR